MSGFKISQGIFLILLSSAWACCPIPHKTSPSSKGALAGLINFCKGLSTGVEEAAPAVATHAEPPPPLEEVPAENQALFIAVREGYLPGLPGQLHFRREFQVRVDGEITWQGELAFGDEKGAFQPEIAWIPEPIMAPRGVHEFKIVDVTTGSEIVAEYACAHPQCWAVVSYSKQFGKLDLIEFFFEKPQY